jgi:alpha-L-fucosidase
MIAADLARPTPEQLAWQRLGMGMFCHFGINTFHGLEWSDGSLPAANFAPARPDPRQWARIARECGFGYLVLTAKHHDGFCLWPTGTTAYGVASSPWRGDLVGETAEACRAEGLGLGLYCSPWDRNAACYADPHAYDDFYCRQLTELCTRYGELAEIWFDGAGSEGRVYDWERIMAVVDRHQPRAMVFNMGRPTIRWAGNEDGVAEEPVRYVADGVSGSAFAGARSALGQARYLPPECDVSLRAGWFWHADDRPKTLEHLLAIWYRSVGLGANLLLNVPPDRDGLIDARDERALRALSRELRSRFTAPATGVIRREGPRTEVRFARPIALDHLELREHLADGQRIDGFSVRGSLGGGPLRPLVSASTVGARRLVAFRSMTVDRLMIETNHVNARIDEVVGYFTGHQRLPRLGPKVDYAEWRKRAMMPEVAR